MFLISTSTPGAYAPPDIIDPITEKIIVAITIFAIIFVFALLYYKLSNMGKSNAEKFPFWKFLIFFVSVAIISIIVTVIISSLL
ncbi:MAG: hypothetical protein IJ398_01985 [Clostridia bacterium]|nr:hypothetical protein [Clostridia bacterium]